VTSGSIEQILL